MQCEQEVSLEWKGTQRNPESRGWGSVHKQCSIASTLHQNSTNRQTLQIVCAISGRQNPILQNSSEAPSLKENQLLLPNTEVCALRSCTHLNEMATGSKTRTQCTAEPWVHKNCKQSEILKKKTPHTDRYIHTTTHLEHQFLQCIAIEMVRERWKPVSNWRRLAMHGIDSIADLKENDKDLLLLIVTRAAILQHMGQHLGAILHDQETLFGAPEVIHHLALQRDDIGMAPQRLHHRHLPLHHLHRLHVVADDVFECICLPG